MGSYATAVTTHPNGAVAGFSYGNGLSHSLTQNLRGLPERSRDVGVLDETTGYDEAGNVVSVVDSLGGLGTRWMAYDGLDRLATVDAVNKYGTASYRYDGLDNLRRSTFASGYDLVGEYTAATGRLACLRLPGSSGCGAAIVGYSYNERGDVTQRAVQGTTAQVFTLDQAHRVRSVSGGASASYRYDGYGHRVARVRGGTMTVQVYDPDGVLRYEAPWGNPGAGTRYAYLNRHLVAKTQSGATTYFHTDALGSPRKETDASAQVVDERRYTAYGWYSNAPTVQEGPDFAGHVRDADTGLSYMLARYYDPFAGRFLGVDPVAVDAVTAENFNRYWYANNNPYRFTDQDGRAACPTGTRICHDSPRTESGTTRQGGRTSGQMATDKQVAGARRGGKLSDGTRLNLSGSKEQGFSAPPDGTKAATLTGQVCVKCSDGTSRTSAGFDASKLGPDESGGHTHPRGIVPLPGPEDGKLARATGKTAYVISERGAFGIEKTNVGYRVWQFDGAPLSRDEAADVRSTIDSWNQHQGGSGVSCVLGC